MLKENLFFNFVFFIASLVSLALFFLGSGFNKSQNLPLEIKVLLSSMGLFLLGLALQFIFQGKPWGNYFVFLPLLSVGLIFGSLKYLDLKNDQFAKNTIKNHLEQNESYLNLGSTNQFPHPSLQYFVREIDSKPEQMLFMVARRFPPIESMDVWGNLSFDRSDLNFGLELTLVAFENGRFSLSEAILLNGFELNPYYFSNVGYYKSKNLIEGNLKRIELLKSGSIHSFELDSNDPFVVKSIETSQDQESKSLIAKPIPFSQMPEILSPR